MHLNNAADLHEGLTAAPAGGGELAEGFMLLRASTLKIVRLQLAIERQDRHLALEAVDDLVALDRRLQAYLDRAPENAEQLMLRRDLESDRAALNEERLALTAGIVRRPIDAVDQTDPITQGTSIEPDEGWPGLSDLQFQPEERRRSRWWLVLAMAVIAAALAAGGYYFASVGEVPAWLPGARGALR
jgi:hypothetical protein